MGSAERKRPPRRPVAVAQLLERLTLFHRSKVEKIPGRFSPIVSRTLGFNQSPYYDRDCRLADCPSSYWGIDRCLRINETVDAFHSRIFYAGAFSCSVDSGPPSPAPLSDIRFAELQRAVFVQFFRLLDWLGVPRNILEATYFGGAELGGPGDGRDGGLTKRRSFPRDDISAQTLRQFSIRATSVPTISHMAFGRFEGALVGPRVDIYCRGVELAAIVFNCFRFGRGILKPTNYVGGYTIGMERLLSALSHSDFLSAVPRYRRARRLIERQSKAARSPGMERDVIEVLFGVEVLAHLPKRLSSANERLVQRMKSRIKPSIHDLGLSFHHITEIYQHFQNARTSKSI